MLENIEMERIQKYISHLQDVLERLKLDDVRQSIDVIMEAYYVNKQIFVIGNGGSASTASHLACDLGKGTSVAGKPRFRVISLTDNVATVNNPALKHGACAKRMPSVHSTS
jgi:D-sedoheptulose 7-phosphate isomerase